jgi:carbamoyl-phosphate synthase small subunit
MTEALLVLADGETFEGIAVGHRPESGVATGEVVFNTALAGYQEILTDPSYAGQIVTFTYPHIGNYGVNDGDDEARAPHCRGIIVRDLARRPSNWRATDDMDGFLNRHAVAGIAGIDTRRLTRHIRRAGAMPGAFGIADRETLLAAAQNDGGTDGCDLASVVTTAAPYTVGPENAMLYVVAYDFGIKRSILDQLVSRGCQVEVVPAGMPAADVLERAPDGVFLSNGPGDPAAVASARDNVRELLGKVMTHDAKIDV